jgi:hypothetical protein
MIPGVKQWRTASELTDGGIFSHVASRLPLYAGRVLARKS